MLAINIEDVISVLNTCKPYLIGLAVVLVLAIVAMVACRKMARSKKFLIRGEAALAMVLAIAVTVNLICFGPMSSLISLAMGDGSVTEETAASANELCQTIAEEGIVMVKNEGALPLATPSSTCSAGPPPTLSTAAPVPAACPTPIPLSPCWRA